LTHANTFLKADAIVNIINIDLGNWPLYGRPEISVVCFRLLFANQKIVFLLP